MTRRATTITVLLFMVISFGGLVFADEPLPPPKSYKIVSDNGRYVFVMLAGSSKEKDSLSKHYKSSGLYYNNGAATPVWTIDWYDYSVLLSPDGKYLLRRGSNLAGRGANLALAFYKEGKLLRRYNVEDLVLSSKVMPRTVGHYLWKKDGSFYYDRTQGLVGIQTYYFNNYVFDVKTGQIVSGAKNDSTVLFMILLLILVPLWFIKKQRKSTRQC